VQVVGVREATEAEATAVQVPRGKFQGYRPVLVQLRFTNLDGVDFSFDTFPIPTGVVSGGTVAPRLSPGAGPAGSPCLENEGGQGFRRKGAMMASCVVQMVPDRQQLAQERWDDWSAYQNFLAGTDYRRAPVVWDITR